MSRRDSMRMSLNPAVVADRQEFDPAEKVRQAATASAEPPIALQALAAIALEDFCDEPVQVEMSESA